MEMENWDVKNLSGEQARAIVQENTRRFKVVEEHITGSRRWSLEYTTIILDTVNDKYYKTYYSIAATECQEEEPYEYEDNVCFVEVEKVSVESYEWKPVNTMEINQMDSENENDIV